MAGYHMGLFFHDKAKATLWLSTFELSYRKPWKTNYDYRIDCKIFKLDNVEVKYDDRGCEEG